MVVSPLKRPLDMPISQSFSLFKDHQPPSLPHSTNSTLTSSLSASTVNSSYGSISTHRCSCIIPTPGTFSPGHNFLISPFSSRRSHLVNFFLFKPVAKSPQVHQPPIPRSFLGFIFTVNFSPTRTSTFCKRECDDNLFIEVSCVNVKRPCSADGTVSNRKNSHSRRLSMGGDDP